MKFRPFPPDDCKCKEDGKDATAVRQCAEFARRTAAGDQTPLIERCTAMRGSIEAAALDGWLPVAPP